MSRYITALAVFAAAVVFMWFSLDDKQSRNDPFLLDTNPLISNNRFLWNGMQQRFFVFHRNVNFSKETTPVENMMMILQSMDSFNLCDEEWLKELQFVSAVLKEQYDLNKHSLDPGIQKLMELQLAIIQQMDVLIKDADASNVVELEKSFGEYMNYYEENIKEGGALDEVSLEH